MGTRYRLGILFSILALTMGIVVFLFLISNGTIGLETYAQSKQEMTQVDTAITDVFDESEEVANTDGTLFMIPLAEGVDEEDFDISMSYITETMYITLEGMDDTYFVNHSMKGASTHIDDLIFVGNGNTCGYEITFDSVYEFETYVEDDNLCISLVDPHDLYDYIVVVDPGHGGSDSPGTVWNGVNEADLVLAIGQYVSTYKEELAEQGIGLYVTRTEDVYTYLSDRAKMANDLAADLFISIHCNALEGAGSASTSGVEVLYSESDESGLSKALAQLCASQVSSVLGARNRGTVKGDEIYIIRTAEVPVALIEMGFMSNQKELSLLQSSSYQKKAAEGIYNVIMTAYREGLQLDTSSDEDTESEVDYSGGDEN